MNTEQDNKAVSKSKDKRATISKLTMEKSVHYSGPIPPPDVLAQYERVLKGSADRILSMAEMQMTHRQELEKKALTANSINSILGTVSGLMIGLAGMGTGAYCIHLGQNAYGIASLFGTIASLAGVFIYGKRSNRKEMIEKQKVMMNLKI